jgi:hypothetical protein
MLDRRRQSVQAILNDRLHVFLVGKIQRHKINGEIALIRLHYIEGRIWEEVCIEMAYSWMQVHRIHAKALEILKTA